MLFYGVGSKRQLLEQFGEEALVDGGVIIFNGYNSHVTAKQVLAETAAALAHRSFRWGGVGLRSIHEQLHSHMAPSKPHFGLAGMSPEVAWIAV